MPTFGLGTWLSNPGEVKAAVEAAIDAGYRHIDAAFCYGNEGEVGAGIKTKIDAGVVKREDLFVTSKLWNTFHRPEHMQKGIDFTLKDLGLDYVDLMLIHWPTAFKFPGDEDARNAFPQDPSGIFMDDEVNFVDTWLALENLYKNGSQMKAIGVSNFNQSQLEQVLAKATVVPMMNQIELHAYLNMTDLRAFCNSHKIHVTGYSPLGAPARPDGLKKGQPVLMEEPVVCEIAKAHNKSAAQTLIKWIIQSGCVCIPKSVTPSRIAANAEIFDFELSADEMAKLNSLNKNIKYVYPDRFVPSANFPWNKDYRNSGKFDI